MKILASHLFDLRIINQVDVEPLIFPIYLRHDGYLELFDGRPFFCITDQQRLRPCLLLAGHLKLPHICHWAVQIFKDSP
jgi:hypothetical protein